MRSPIAKTAAAVTQLLRSFALLSVLAALCIAAAGAAQSQEARMAPPSEVGMEVTFPIADAERGKAIFVNRGCVICHTVNNVGGRIAPPLDVGKDHHTIKPYELMARMWRGAREMIRLQDMELGYRIDFRSDELANLFGFLSNPKVQKTLREEDIPDLIRDMIITDLEHWSKKLKNPKP
jgi:hypothetical protein